MLAKSTEITRCLVSFLHSFLYLVDDPSRFLGSVFNLQCFAGYVLGYLDAY